MKPKPRQVVAACTAGMPPVVATAFVLYLLSLAPMVRLTGQCPDQLGYAYAPANWLLHNTCLSEPMLEWADEWSVRSQLEASSERLLEPGWFRRFTMSDEARAIERRLGIDD